MINYIIRMFVIFCSNNMKTYLFYAISSNRVFVNTSFYLGHKCLPATDCNCQVGTQVYNPGDIISKECQNWLVHKCIRSNCMDINMNLNICDLTEITMTEINCIVQYCHYSQHLFTGSVELPRRSVSSFLLFDKYSVPVYRWRSVPGSIIRLRRHE